MRGQKPAPLAALALLDLSPAASAETFPLRDMGKLSATGGVSQLVHGKMGVSNLQFNAQVEDRPTAMDKNHIPSSAQNKLPALLAPIHCAIVRPALPQK